MQYKRSFFSQILQKMRKNDRLFYATLLIHSVRAPSIPAQRFLIS